MMVQPSTVNGEELSAQEWQDALFLIYGIDPPDLHKLCDGRNSDFSICHPLGCKKGGLVTANHHNLCDGVADLVGKAFTPTYVCDDPLIFVG